MAKRFTFLLAAILILGGCASLPREELQAARTALEQALAAGAQDLAPTEWQAASAALYDGEELIRQKKYRLAREVLPFAAAHAKRAALRVEQELANLELEKIRQQQLQEESPAPSPPPPTKPTIQAISEQPPARRSSPPPPPKASLLLERYQVSAGETLWTIAVREDVYSDPLLWPLIYQANRDQIKDPRHIYPGQVLTIPRKLSQKTKADAREKARRSKLFSSEGFPLD